MPSSVGISWLVVSGLIYRSKHSASLVNLERAKKRIQKLQHSQRERESTDDRAAKLRVEGTYVRGWIYLRSAEDVGNPAALPGGVGDPADRGRGYFHHASRAAPGHPIPPSYLCTHLRRYFEVQNEYFFSSMRRERERGICNFCSWVSHCNAILHGQVLLEDIPK